jgi:phosphoribosylamine---glycine ligase
MKVLLVGSGGREHALAWRLAQTDAVELHAAPGNPGIAELGECHPVRAHDAEGLLSLARTLEANLVVIGPEAPLVTGVADELRHAGIAVFGPSAAAARIEGSKSFAKEAMRVAGVPTAASLSVARPPCVVKLDGLAAGKGVFVCHSAEKLDAALKAAARAGGQVVIEELLEGEELSVFAICDGARAVPLAPARDFKRLADSNEGPNTGGMGSYSPVAEIGPDRLAEIVATVHAPVLDELSRRGTPFIGLLYAGLMLTAAGLKVLEFNCRFGDPETQSILPRLEGDLLGALAAAAGGDLGETDLGAGDEAAVTVVLAGGDYPERADSGGAIEGVEDAKATGALVFHAGTAIRNGRLVTNGGRILNVTARGPSLADAREAAYTACERITFPRMRYRRDIAAEEAGVAR